MGANDYNRERDRMILRRPRTRPISAKELKSAEFMAKIETRRKAVG